jgi:hypothetical protein
MICKSCGAGPESLSRRSRRGFLERHIFPLFGLYPWKCSSCEHKHLYHARYKKGEDRESRAA